ncbi:MAG: hypothetical protein ACM3TN_16400 [Alphaproteobacteria bacterium]
MTFRDTDLKRTEALARQEREYTESIVGSVRWADPGRRIDRKLDQPGSFMVESRARISLDRSLFTLETGHVEYSWPLRILLEKILRETKHQTALSRA